MHKYKEYVTNNKNKNKLISYLIWQVMNYFTIWLFKLPGREKLCWYSVWQVGTRGADLTLSSGSTPIDDGLQKNVYGKDEEKQDGDDVKWHKDIVVPEYRLVGQCVKRRLF